MHIAVSNIAWPKDRDADVAGLLNSGGVSGIEVALTKIWPRPLEARPSEIAVYRRFWNERGLSIVAAQALLFGRPELTIFDNEEARQQTLEYLRGIIRLCAQLGARHLVFGSPKNRRIETKPREAIWPVAIEFFARLGETAATEGTCVVLEANPPIYGADFITCAAEALELVRAVNHPGIRLHLDTACMELAGDPAEATIETAIPLLRHFHVSEPQLGVVGQGQLAHAHYAELLRRHAYSGWVSIEMREPAPFALETLANVVDYVNRVYATA